MVDAFTDYTIQREMGRGGFAVTWLASSRRSQYKTVILKELLLDKIEDWDVLSAFEREARVLSHLKHPGIPAFVDYFEKETPQGKRVFLAQDFIAGRDLQALIQDGRYFTEAEVVELAIQMARVLVYLHQFSPPIVHRDIKPGNIMAAEDQRYYLVDFGAVKAPQGNKNAGYTMTGTVGYMPLEQVEGKALPASDIYALGMTLIYVLSHRAPQDMEKRQLRVDFRPHVNVSEPFARLIDKMIAPAIEQRYQKATVLLADLEALQRSGTEPAAPFSWRRYAKALAGAAIAMGILGWCSLREWRQEQALPVAAATAVPTPTASLQGPSDQEMGNYYYQKKDYTQAIVYYDRYLAQFPNAFSERFRRGFSHGEKEAHEKAIVDFAYVVKHDPTPDPMAYHNLGYHHYALGHYDTAKVYFQTTLEHRPKDTSALNYLGLVAMHQNQFNQAVTWLKKGIAVDPEYTYFYNNLGQVYLRQKKYPEALAALDQCIAKDQVQQPVLSKQYARPYLHKAEVYLAQNQPQKTLEMADQALLRIASYGEAIALKAKAYQALKQCPQALEMARLACEKSQTEMCQWSCP